LPRRRFFALSRRSGNRLTRRRHSPRRPGCPSPSFVFGIGGDGEAFAGGWPRPPRRPNAAQRSGCSVIRRGWRCVLRLTNGVRRLEGVRSAVSATRRPTEGRKTSRNIRRRFPEPAHPAAAAHLIRPRSRPDREIRWGRGPHRIRRPGDGVPPPLPPCSGTVSATFAGGLLAGDLPDVPRRTPDWNGLAQRIRAVRRHAASPTRHGGFRSPGASFQGGPPYSLTAPGHAPSGIGQRQPHVRPRGRHPSLAFAYGSLLLGRWWAHARPLEFAVNEGRPRVPHLFRQEHPRQAGRR